MNASLFEGLIHDAVREITGRHAEYFSQYTLNVPPLDQLADDYRQHSSFSSCDRDELVGAMTLGFRLAEGDGIVLRHESTLIDPVAVTLADSIVDAYLAAMGTVALAPAIRGTPGTLPLVDCTDRITDSGVRYVQSKNLGRHLIVISSTGTPISVWSHLLGDPDVDGRCVFVESRSGPLVGGGTPYASSLSDDLACIEEVLRTEKLSEVSVLGWCDGARVAIELTRRMPDRVRSLMLLAPTFHGAVESAEYPSPFEDTLAELCSMLGRDTRKDRFLLDSIAKSAFGDLSANSSDLSKRAAALLRLPPQAYASDLLMPLSTVESFRNYVNRLCVDERYDVRSALTELACPITFLTGTDDAAVNTTAARDMLARHARNVVQVTVRGAGHHIHLLQYDYFRYVLNCFLNGIRPAQLARMTVETLQG